MASQNMLNIIASGGVDPVQRPNWDQKRLAGQRLEQRNALFQQDQQDRQRQMQMQEQERVNSEILNAAAPMLMPGVSEEQAAAYWQQTAPGIKQKYPKLQIPDQYPGRQALVGMLPLPPALRDKMIAASLTPQQPMEVSPGASLVDPKSNRVLMTAPNKPDATNTRLVPLPDPNSPTGYSYGLPAEGGAAAPPKNAAASRLPPSIQKAEDDDIEAIQIASAIDKDMGAVLGQLQRGEIDLGPVDNLVSRGRNWAGASDQRSRNYASFVAALEKLRNDSLRLNKGVQTEGDAIRAWNELFANLNDPAVVQQRLGEIQGYNQRAVEFRDQTIQNRRNSYGREALDTEQFRANRSIIGGPAKNANPPTIKEGATATNPKTGEKIVFRNGTWVKQ